MNKLSPWIVIDGYCATRVFVGTDPNDVKNRMAFIEKSPRVKIEAHKYCVKKRGEFGCSMAEHSGWIYGPKGSGGSGNHETEGNYGFNEESRKWCDSMLILLGYELT